MIEQTRAPVQGVAGQPPPRARRWSRRRRALLVIALVAVVALGWLGDSLGRALTAPGSDSVAARLAEWGRFHHLGPLVTGLEKVQYDLNPPRTGGAPAGGVPRAAGGAVGGAPQPVTHLPAPPAVALQTRPALAGEGQWQTLVSVHGQPAIRAAFLRPDPVHSSYLAGVAWMDPRLLRFTLHPGTAVPGGSGWSEPPTVPAVARGALVATFNSGFVMRDARGGYWQGGKGIGALRAGAASLVFYADGHADVVAWVGAAPPGPNVVAVRQNLDLIVDQSRPVAGLRSDSSSRWGATLGNDRYVWRSAVGVTTGGALVYVAGNALSVQTLAQLESAAGAVRAMELDINPEWTSYMTYTHPAPGVAAPHKLTADEQHNANRYLTTSSRDFIAVSARP